MAPAETVPTPIDDAASKASLPWPLLEEVFGQWRDRLGSSENAKDSLYDLLFDRETRAAIQYTSASEGITRRDIQRAEFWQDRLGLDTDADGVEHLRVNYAPYVHEDYSLLYGWSREFVVRRRDVERWERLYPELAAPSEEPAPSEELSNKQRQKPGPKPDSKYWETMEAKCSELMDYNGDFTPEDSKWDRQARLEESLMDFSQNTLGRELGESTLREKLPGWLSAWRERKTGAA